MTGELTIIPRLDAMPRAVSFAQTSSGRVALVLAFTTALLLLRTAFWWQIGVVLTLTSLFPAQRKQLLVLAAAAWVFLRPPVDVPLLTELAPQRGAGTWVGSAWPIAVVLTWTIAFSYLWAVRRFPKSPIGRRPVLGLVVLLLALLAVAQAPLRGFAWFIVAATAMCFSKYVWFFAYWVSENMSKAATPNPVRIGFWRPFWGFTNVPFGKGAAYLERVEAKGDQQLATVQLKGVRLLIWAMVLTLGLSVANRALFGWYDGYLLEAPPFPPDPVLPTYAMVVEAERAGHPYSWAIRWTALIASFVLHVMWATIFGHKIIAILRMAGFDAFRNTYRPFESTTIAEFFNRIYYYFKELLVAFFFYPTYLRYFKKHPRVRLFAATFMAAGVGNFLFHFLRDHDNLFRRGFWDGLAFYAPYAVYALILSVAIGLSQLRALAHRRAGAPHGLSRLRAIAGVLFFYALICVFAQEPNERHGLREYGAFFISLFRPY